MEWDEWQYHWKKGISRLHFQHGLPHFRARQIAYEDTVDRFGPEPPKPKKPGGLKAALLRIVGRSIMPEGLKKWIRRWGVVLSVLYLGAVAALNALAERGVCEMCGTASGFIQTLFGLLELTPDPSLGPEVAAVVAGALAVYGGTRKIISIVRKPKTE